MGVLQERETLPRWRRRFTDNLSPWWVAIGVLNLVLALAAYQLVPEHSVATSDRQGYEWIAQHGLAPGCPHATFCYRVLVPLALAHLPLPAAVAWGLYPVVANAAAGLVLAVCCARLAGRLASAGPRSLRAALLGSIMAQTSFGFTFAVFDPYTPDPAVFLAGSLLIWAWLADRPRVALGVAVVSVFAKETVALVSAGLAIAALLPPRRPDWRGWVGQAVAAGTLLLAFHATMDRLAGWSIAGTPAADLAAGAWLALWVRSQQPATAVFLLFATFGFGWLFAALGLRGGPDRLRRLALGLAPPLLMLVYVQNVERALGNLFLVVVPAAVVFLVSVPFGVALLAAIANGLLTARVGLSSDLLPSSLVLLPAASAAAVWTLLVRARAPRSIPAVMLLGLGLAACSAPGLPGPARTPTAPTATAEAVGTQARQAADAQVRRISGANPAATPTPSPTPVPRPACAGAGSNAIWWYEARAHLGEQRTIQGQVVRVRRLSDGGSLLEVGQFYPDPNGLVVRLPSAVAEQTYVDKSVCVSGTIFSDGGSPALRARDLGAIVVVG